MTRPTDKEIRLALEAAEQLREKGADSAHMAHTLLYWQHYLQSLEQVAQAADRYIRFGQGEAEHGKLVRALEKLRRERHEAEDEEGYFGVT